MDPHEVLAQPNPRYAIMPRFLFWLLDTVYGAATTFEKAAALELLARQPYEAWRHGAFTAVSHTATSTPEFARDVQARAARATEQSDNETWHLLILHELLHKQGYRIRFAKDRVIPQVLAWVAFHMAFFLYIVRPLWSYRFNRDFEDHASRIYAQFILDTGPDLDVAWESAFNNPSDYGSYATLRDMVTRVMIDEVEHRDDSQALMEHARFGS